MYVGIDLGTTNSALATFDGTTLAVVPNQLGEVLTPSIVRLDTRGTVTVGRRAARFLDSDPPNTRGEWKRLMGSAERLEFPAAKKTLTPEELSGHVVASLLADATDVLGFAPRAAVISTPALFELPQNHATTRAGQLGGLGEVTLIQEPIASALAAGWAAAAQGFWLVFDLGGGTLDVSLLETRDGWLRVVDHAGDNFLGGKDFDGVLLDWAISRLKADHDLPHLDRANPEARRPLGKLKAACEQAKIELSRAERARIVVPELGDDAAGQMVEVDLEVERAVFETLVAPLVERSVAVVTEALARNKVEVAALERLVFVGGPTLMPALRGRVAEALGGKVAEGIDPMTAVARGAALYAATAGLAARPAATGALERAPGVAVKIEHPAVTADLHPYVVGRFLPAPGEELPRRVRVVALRARADSAVDADPESDVSPAGSFVAQVSLSAGRQNRFRLVAFDGRGAEVPVRSPELTIVHGLSIGDPPLSRSVGVARADDHVHVYFEKGTPLPARRSFLHKTVAAVPAGSAEDPLRIPVVQGESMRAHRNRLIGTLVIEGRLLGRDLPAGTDVEVTLELDRSGQLRARADVPAAGQSFEDVVHLLVPAASAETLAHELGAAEKRLAAVRGRSFKLGHRDNLRRLDAAAALMDEVKAGLPAATGGDADAGQRVYRLLLDLGATLDAVEEEYRWPEREQELEQAVNGYLSVAVWATPGEQQLFDRALAATELARKSRDAAELERQLRVIRNLAHAAWARDPDYGVDTLNWYASRVSEATDLPRAHELIARGRELCGKNDAAGLRTVNAELGRLFPASSEKRLLSFGSGVQ